MSSQYLQATYRQVPQILYRIQPRFPVSLREHSKQVKLGKTSFDLKLGAKGLVHPVKLEQDVSKTPFTGPNGMSLRPRGMSLAEILGNQKQSDQLFILPKGLVIPDYFVLIHEYLDHYSLQTAESCALSEFNQRLTNFLKPLKSITVKQYFEKDITEKDV